MTSYISFGIQRVSQLRLGPPFLDKIQSFHSSDTVDLYQLGVTRLIGLSGIRPRIEVRGKLFAGMTGETWLWMANSQCSQNELALETRDARGRSFGCSNQLDGWVARRIREPEAPRRATGM